MADAIREKKNCSRCQKSMAERKNTDTKFFQFEKDQ